MTVRLSFLDAGSLTGLEIRMRDWSDSPLGSPETWPPALCNTLSLMLACPRAMFLAWGPDLLCFYNDAYRPILGYRLTTALGQPFRQVWGSIWQDIGPLVDATLAGETRTLTDMKLDLARGGEPEESWWSFTYSPVFDDDGMINGLFCVTAETTDHVLSEAALRESEDHYRHAVELNPQVLWTCDPIGQITSYGARWLALTGQAAGEPLGDGWTRAVHPDDLPATVARFEASLSSGNPVDVDYRIRDAATGSYKWMRARAYPRLDDEGSIIRWYGVVEDIHDRKLAEIELQAREVQLQFQIALADKLRSAASSLEVEVVAASSLGRHLKAGRAGYGHIRQNGEVVSVEQDWSDGEMPSLAGEARVLDAFGPLLISELRDGRTLVVTDCRTDPRTSRPEFIASFESIGTRALIVVPLVRGTELSGVFYVHSARPRAWSGDEVRLTEDVAARTWSAYGQAQAEAALRGLNATLEERVAARTAELEQTHEALRQAQKMEAVGQLTGGVAHDFNNLLTIIRSSVDFLRRPGLPEDRRIRYLDAVSDTVDRAAKLTGQLLAFARRQALKPEVFDVRARLVNVADLLERVTGARIRIVVELPETTCYIRADVTQFETALINMAVNARDAMDGKGTLTITLGCSVPLPEIRRHAGNPGRFAAISLSDTGSGIAADVLERMFEPFFTTKEVGRGTGLGLSQAFGFAKQSGGDIAVATELGKGTTFTLYLPEALTDQVVSAPESDQLSPCPDGAGMRVLLVEDNLDVAGFAEQILRDFGYAATWVTSGESALEELDRPGLRYDVVVSDVVMPGMGGVALAEELRRRWPALPVLLASGYSDVLASDQKHGFQLLQKPYSAEQLGHMLNQVVKGAPLVSEH